MFSFGTPCLQSKQIGYLIAMNGTAGFLAPNFKRYLQVDCTWTRDDSAFGPTGLDGQGAIISGTISSTYGSPTTTASGPTYGGHTQPGAPIPINYPFYGSSPPTNDPANQWTVAENTFTAVQKIYYAPNPNPRILTTTVTLSHEYTPSQLEADGDSQLAALIASGITVNWGDTFIAQFGERPTPGIITSLDDYQPDPGEFIAAYSGMGFTSIGTAGTQYPNAFIKVIGYVMMAGLYRKRTYLIDFDPTHTIPSDGGIQCVSASGSCGSSFVINPPPANPVQNAFVTITPNRQCP